MIYDLHAHSTASDGILSPAALVSRAKSRGVACLALTDHDTLQGLAEAAQKAEQLDMGFVTGIELSTQWREQSIHIVGLNFDPAHRAMLTAVSEQTRIRRERAETIAARLADIGIAGAWQGAREHAESDQLGRPHFAKFLVASGICDSIGSAFRDYLGTGKAGDVANVWLTMEQVVEAITAAGGTAILAHPLKYKLSRGKLMTLCQAFKTCGGAGLEVISGDQKINDTYNLALLAKQVGLHASCGSDFHMPDQAWQELGVCGTLPKDCQPVWNLWQRH